MQTDIGKCKVTNWKKRLKNRADWVKSVGRRRSALDSRAKEEEEEEEEEEG